MRSWLIYLVYIATARKRRTCGKHTHKRDSNAKVDNAGREKRNSLTGQARNPISGTSRIKCSPTTHGTGLAFRRPKEEGLRRPERGEGPNIPRALSRMAQVAYRRSGCRKKTLRPHEYRRM